MASVYILVSVPKGTYYIGSTNNWNRRWHEHQIGRVRSTRWLRPLKIMLVQHYSTVAQARRIEYRIKRLKRKDYVDKIVKDGFIKMGG